MLHHPIIFYPMIESMALAKKVVDDIEMQNAVKVLLRGVGEDPGREGLLETPERYVKFLRQFLYPEAFEFKTFDGEKYDEMVVVGNIPFFSLCEHHMAPFFGVGHIAYVPDKKICGLSKLPRTLDFYARRLQNQERITTQVAEYIQEQLKPKGVAVVLEARHLCIEMRGIKKHNVNTHTSKLLGVMNEAAARSEFFNLISKK